MLLRLRLKILRFEITKLSRLAFCRQRFPFFFYQQYITFVVQYQSKCQIKNGGSLHHPGIVYRQCPPPSVPCLLPGQHLLSKTIRGRYMTFRQVHRSGEHWNFLIIVFIAAEPCNWDGSGSVSRKLSRFRLRIRLRAKCPGGSGSGSEQSVPVPAAPAPHPCYIAIQELFTGSVPPLYRVRGPANICRTQFDA